MGTPREKACTLCTAHDKSCSRSAASSATPSSAIHTATGLCLHQLKHTLFPLPPHQHSHPPLTPPTPLSLLLAHHPFPPLHHTPYILHLHRLLHRSPSLIHRPPCLPHQRPAPPSPHTPHTHIRTTSALRCRAMQELLPEFETRPALVMLTECNLPLSALAELRSTAHRMLLLYAVFTNCLSKSTRKARQISVITLTCGKLFAPRYTTAAGCRLVSYARCTLSRALCASPAHSEVSLLNLNSRVIKRWGGLSDHVIIGGDWTPGTRLCSSVSSTPTSPTLAGLTRGSGL